MKNGVKVINKVLLALKSKGDQLNTELIKGLKIQQATFYALRRKLQALKRIDSKYRVIDTRAVTAEELAAIPYPYSKNKRGAKSWGEAMGKSGGVKVALKDALTIPVADTRDKITLTYDELVRIVIAAKGVK